MRLILGISRCSFRVRPKRRTAPRGVASRGRERVGPRQRRRDAAPPGEPEHGCYSGSAYERLAAANGVRVGSVPDPTARPRHRTRRATLDDVAQCAGVSYQTVSRVVNDHPSVAAATRSRVLEAIEKLGYRPNRAARSLVTRRSNTIGMVSFSTKYYGPGQMVVNLETALRHRGFSLTLTTLDGNSLAEMRRAIDELTARNLDGLVIITPVAGIDFAAVEPLCGDTPFVMIDALPDERAHSIVIDQLQGARLATQHLIGLGHRTVAEISGPLEWHDARFRHQGWLASLASAGLAPGPSVASDWTAAGGHAAARELLGLRQGFSALFVGNDQMALGAMSALRDAGLQVPEDVSVVGFDDVPEAAFFDPPLTTVRQDFQALGRQSVDYLTTLIDAPDTLPHQRVLHPQLIVRASTTKASAERPDRS
jgi:DNA-binding LacI/PurR family transcriptional regulator